MSIEDVSSRALADITQGGPGAYENRHVISGATGPTVKKLTSTHENVLKKIGEGLFLGPWSKALLYGVRYWKKNDHRALVQLVRSGKLRVIEVRGPDLATYIAEHPFPEPSEPSGSRQSEFAYILVPHESIWTARAHGTSTDPWVRPAEIPLSRL